MSCIIFDQSEACVDSASKNSVLQEVVIRPFLVFTELFSRFRKLSRRRVAYSPTQAHAAALRIEDTKEMGKEEVQKMEKGQAGGHGRGTNLKVHPPFQPPGYALAQRRASRHSASCFRRDLAGPLAAAGCSDPRRTAVRVALARRFAPEFDTTAS